MDDLTFTNKRGDKLTVKCGGTGGDNVLGTVEEKVSGGNFVPVKDAKVTVVNHTEDDMAETKTNANGVFDVDVDAGCKDQIVVSVEWTTNGRKHEIYAIFRCTCGKKEEAAYEKRHGRPTADDRLAQISLIEGQMDSLIEKGLFQTQVALEVQWDALMRVVEDLSALAGERGSELQKEGLDKRLLEEVLTLLEKIRRFGPIPPPPQFQWVIMLELIGIIFKLVAKVFLLQEKPIPEFERPRPWSIPS